MSKPWTDDEVDELCRLVSLDTFSFGDIAALLPGRNRDQVTSQWYRIAAHYERRLAIRNRMNGF